MSASLRDIATILAVVRKHVDPKTLRAIVTDLAGADLGSQSVRKTIDLMLREVNKDA